MPLCPRNRPSGEPVPTPAYPIPPPGEYYATARWVREYVDRAVASVDNEGTKKVIDELIASWDPSFAMRRVTGYTGQLAKLDETGQAVGSGLKVEDLATQESIKTLSDALERKVDGEPGKGLSTNDFTNELKNKLESLTPGSGGGPGIHVDATLTVAGAAADAAAVGSKVVELKESLDTTLAEVSEYASAAVTAAEDAKLALNSARQKGDNTIYNGDGEPTTATYVSSVVVEGIQAQLADKVSQAEFAAVSALESRVQELSQSIDGRLLQSRAKTDLNVYDSEGSPTGGQLATSVDLSSKADKSELEYKADKSELDSKADKSELDDKADVSALGPLRSKTDLQVYNSDGQPDADDNIATEKWVTDFLSRNYDVAETTTYGTEE